MPSWLGTPELIIIALIAFLIFGAKRLPDAARSLGRSLRIFKAETKGLKGDFKDGYGEDSDSEKAKAVTAGEKAAESAESDSR
jgi:sec-independent protein translocase protein TatA